MTSIACIVIYDANGFHWKTAIMQARFCWRLKSYVFSTKSAGTGKHWSWPLDRDAEEKSTVQVSWQFDSEFGYKKRITNTYGYVVSTGTFVSVLLFGFNTKEKNITKISWHRQQIRNINLFLQIFLFVNFIVESIHCRIACSLADLLGLSSVILSNSSCPLMSCLIPSNCSWNRWR